MCLFHLQGIVHMPDTTTSETYDGYEASVSERHSDTTSDTTVPEPNPHKAQRRAVTISPSLRSSAASTDDMLSPVLAQYLTNSFSGGFIAATVVQSDLQSSFSGSAVTDLADGGANHLAETDRLSHVVLHATGNEPHQRNMSPELGMLLSALPHMRVICVSPY